MATNTTTSGAKRVRKAIIPAAGFGSRMLPATKSIPKEMLPVVDRPIIDYIVREAFAAGIEHVVIVSSRMKNEIEDYFDLHPELFSSLESSGKTELLERLRSDVPDVGRLSFVRQQVAKGLGHAVWTPRSIIGDEPFAVLLPDMLMRGPEPCLKTMVDEYEQTGGNVLAVQACDPDDVSKYGIVSIRDENGHRRIDGMVEKPKKEDAPSNLYVSGRYILQPEIFDILENQPRGAGDEIQLTDAIVTLMDRQPIYASEFAGETYDCGNPAGFVNANLAVAREKGLAVG